MIGGNQVVRYRYLRRAALCRSTARNNAAASCEGRLIGADTVKAVATPAGSPLTGDSQLGPDTHSLMWTHHAFLSKIWQSIKHRRFPNIK